MGFWAAIGPDQRVLHYLAVNISYPSRKEKNDDPKAESEISPDPKDKATTSGQRGSASTMAEGQQR